MYIYIYVYLCIYINIYSCIYSCIYIYRVKGCTPKASGYLVPDHVAVARRRGAGGSRRRFEKPSRTTHWWLNIIYWHYEWY